MTRANRKMTVLDEDFYALAVTDPAATEQRWIVVPAGTPIRYMTAPRTPRIGMPADELAARRAGRVAVAA